MGRLAVLSLTDPDGPSQGATLRVGSLCRALEIAGHEVHRLHPDPPAGPSGRPEQASTVRRLKRHLLPMPTTYGGRDPVLAERLRSLGHLDGVVVTALSQAPLTTLLPGVPVWADFLDLWSSFGAVEARGRRGLARLTSTAQVGVLRRHESVLCRRATTVTAVGWQDVAELRRRGAEATWLPTTLPDSAFDELPLEVERTVGLLADFGYWPNRDAFARLVRDWLGPLRDRGWTVVVAGRASGTLPRVEGVTCLGEVPETRDFYRQVSATAAPIALGGGMKVKVVESLAHGRPVLASRPATEGLPPEVAGLVASSPLDHPDLDALEARTLDRALVLRLLEPYRRAALEQAVRSQAARLLTGRG